MTTSTPVERLRVLRRLSTGARAHVGELAQNHRAVYFQYAPDYLRQHPPLSPFNHDDHARNWAFLQDDAGRWTPSPCYDVTFNPSPHNEHCTAFLGHGAAPPLIAMRKLARQANFPCWPRARDALRRVAEAISGWQDAATQLGVRRRTRQLVAKHLAEVHRANAGLLA